MVVKIDDAKTMTCPLLNSKCVADACMFWYEMNKEGDCTIRRYLLKKMGDLY